MVASITAARPREVAVQVEAAKRRGCSTFLLLSIDGGGMLDLERLGAARYAAGLQAVVELKCSTSTAAVASGSSN